MAQTIEDAISGWMNKEFSTGLDTQDQVEAFVHTSFQEPTSKESRDAEQFLIEQRNRPPIDWKTFNQVRSSKVQDAANSIGGMRNFNNLPYDSQLLLINEQGGFQKPEEFRFENKRQAEFDKRFREVEKKNEAERLAKKQSGGQTIGPAKPAAGMEDFFNGLRSSFFRMTPPGSLRASLFGSNDINEVMRPTEGTAGSLGQVVGSVIPSAAALLSPAAWPWVLSIFGASAASQKFEETDSALSAIGAGVFEAGSELLQFKTAAKIGKATLTNVGKLIKNGKVKDASKVMLGALGVSATEGFEEDFNLVGTELVDVVAGVQSLDQAVSNIREQAIPTFLLGTAGGSLLNIPILSSKQARKTFLAALDVESSVKRNEQPLPESIDILTGLFGTPEFDITTQEPTDATRTEGQVEEAGGPVAIEEQPVEAPAATEVEEGIAQRESEGQQEEVAPALQPEIERQAQVETPVVEAPEVAKEIASNPGEFITKTVSTHKDLSQEDLSNINEARIRSELIKPFGRLELNRLARDIGVDPTNKTGETLANEVLKKLPSVSSREGGFVDPELFTAPIKAAIKAAKWTGQTTTDAARWLYHATGGAIDKISSARKMLIGKFGDGVKNKIGAIWTRFKGFMAGNFEFATPDSVFAGAKPVSKNTLSKFAKEIKGAKKVRREASEAIRKERRRRAAVVANIQSTNTGKTAVVKSLSAMKGQMESITQDFEPLAGKISVEETNELIDHLNNHPSLDGKPITKASLGAAVLNIIENGQLPKPGQIQALEAIFGPRVVSALLGKRSKKQKALSTFDEIVGLPRAIKSSVDLSAAGRQGFIVSLAHPKLAQEAFMNQMVAFANEDYSIALDQQMRSMPGFELAELAGLELPPVHGIGAEIADREELFVGQVIQKMTHVKGKTKAGKAILILPKLAAMPVRASERAYITYLNQIRIGSFLGIAEQMVDAGQTFDTHADDFKLLARLINTSTGRGTTGFTASETGFSLKSLINFAIFSPKFLVSRLENLFVALPQASISNNKFVRREAHRQAASVMATWLLLAGIIKVAKDAYDIDEIGMSLKPESADFLKLRITDGKTTFTTDFSAAFGPLLRTMVQSTTGHRIDPVKEKRLKTNVTVSGAFFLRGKLAPVPSAAVSAREGQSFGQKTTVAKEVGKLFVPISLETLYEVWKADNAIGYGLMVPEILGLGVQVKTEKPKARKRKRSKLPALLK